LTQCTVSSILTERVQLHSIEFKDIPNYKEKLGEEVSRNKNEELSEIIDSRSV
jgi:hypothetical protein